MISKDIQTKIKYKAKWVHKRNPTLSIPTLMQEAYTLLYSLKRKFNDNVSDAYLLAAVSYHFNNLIRAHRKERNLSFYSLSSMYEKEDKDMFGDLENFLDREGFIKSIADKQLVDVINALCLGYSVKEIATEKKMSVRQVYRYVNALKSLRRKWDKEC